ARTEKAHTCVGRHPAKHVSIQRLARLALAVVVVSGLRVTPVHAADPAPFAVSGTRAAPEITRLFSRTNGWIGGDGEYSVPIDGEKALWTFGDTWIGRIHDGKRVDCRMINNTAAVQSLGSDSRIEFHWRSKDGKPTALWEPSDRGEYYWPGDAAKV